MKKLYLFLFLLMMICISKFSSAQCTPSFTWLQTANNVIQFTNTTTDAYSTSGFEWHFPDYHYDTSSIAVDTFNVPGTYNVCLYYFDSFNNCNASYCDSVTVTGVLICNLSAWGDIYYYSSCDTCADGFLLAVGVDGTSPYTYLWTPSNQTSQYISNLLSGTYTVTDRKST